MHKFNPFKFYFINDLRDVDHGDVMQKVDTNTQFSVSYLLMLLVSTVVCSLGLILDSAAIVIGGMIISPLMWPLMKISFGVSYERRSFIQQAIQILIASILIVLLVAFTITYFSPIKVLSQQILTRTNPTLLDLIVAMAAGAIAAFGLVQKKISSSLAGVAIATSLMPPLCVSGIGLALQNYSVALSGFLLFFSNVISIIFISVFIFRFVGIKRHSDQSIHRKGILVIFIILILTSMPLLYLLRNYSFRTKVYQESQQAIEASLASISNLISIQSIKTDTRKEQGEETIFIEADITVPEDISLDYQQKNAIISSLEEKFHKKVNLNFRIQKTLALKSESDVRIGTIKSSISRTLEAELSKFNGSLSVSSIDIQPKEGDWSVNVIARVNPNIPFSEKDRNDLQDVLSQTSQQTVTLNISLIPLIELKSEPDEVIFNIKEDLNLYLSLRETFTEVTSIIVEKIDDQSLPSYLATIHVETLNNNPFSQSSLEDLKEYIQTKYQINFNLIIKRVQINLINI